MMMGTGSSSLLATPKLYGEDTMVLKRNSSTPKLPTVCWNTDGTAATAAVTRSPKP